MPPLNTRIKPSDISPTTASLTGAFGCQESEQVAGQLVRLCQGRNGWVGVSQAELAHRSGGNYRRGIQFLLKNGYLNERDGKIFVTTEFVRKCHRFAPAE